MSLIAVTGSGGQLGQEIAFLADYMPGHSFLFLDSDELDISDKDAIQDVLEEYAIDYLINCAAYTKVDLAESESERAFAVNTRGASYLAKYCDDNDIVLIHISTDYVYHNDIRIPLKENDPTTPKGVYAVSKLEGEQAILDHCERSLIFRTSWVYSSYGHNFMKTMINLSETKKTVNVVSDQIGAPTYARDLADRILTIVNKLAEETLAIEDVKGIYNIANEGETSWYGFAKAIFQLSGIDIEVLPITTDQYPTPASRPQYSVFDMSKLKSTFHVQLPYWEDSLVKCLKALKED